MHWESLQAFIHMGGYATYVWGAFGSTAALMAQIRVEKEHLAEQLKTLREDAALRREVYGT